MKGTWSISPRSTPLADPRNGAPKCRSRAAVAFSEPGLALRWGSILSVPGDGPRGGRPNQSQSDQEEQNGQDEAPAPVGETAQTDRQKGEPEPHSVGEQSTAIANEVEEPRLPRGRDRVMCRSSPHNSGSDVPPLDMCR